MPTRNLALLLALAGVFAGCVGAPAETPAALDAPADSASLLAPLTETLEGDVLVSAATPARTLNFGGAYVFGLAVGPNATGHVVEVEWAAATPATQTLAVWVRPAGAGAVGPEALTSSGEPLGMAQGPSPLRIALPAEAYPEPGDYEIVVRAAAAPVGVALSQPFTMHVTTFLDIPFDETFSVVGAGEA